MNQPTKRGTAARVAPAADETRLGVGATTVLALLVPGAGHASHGQTRKAVTFFVVLMAMFVFGLMFGGRLFPLQLSDPLVFLAAIAEWAVAVPRLIGAAAGFGAGRVVADTYEYGNSFLITAGLLNLLVVLDARDLAAGRKS
jgi:hypothetical protein